MMYEVSGSRRQIRRVLTTTATVKYCQLFNAHQIFAYLVLIFTITVHTEP